MAGLRSIGADVGKLRWDQADLLGSVRCTLAVMVPLVIGLAEGSIADGVFAAIGSLSAGFASFQGAYRRRVSIMALVAFGMAAATVTGAIADRAAWSAIIVVALWGAVAGMIASIGQAYLVIGLQWGVAAIIVNEVPMTTGQALVRGGLIAAGGGVQMLFTIATWSIRTYPAERAALAAVYRDLASSAKRPALASQAATSEAVAVPTALDEARAALSDPQPFGREHVLLAFQALLDEAYRLQAGLTAFGGLQRLEPSSSAIAEFTERCSRALRSIATALLSDRTPTTSPSEFISGPDAFEAELGPDLASLGAAVAGQIRSALTVAGVVATRRSMAAADKGSMTPLPDRRGWPATDALGTLRANVSWQSGYFRHAIRLAAALAIAMTIYRASGLAHGYWIAMTALLVLRADYGQTTVRGLSRVLGTLIGAVLSTLLLAAIHPDITGLTIMLGIAVLAAFVTVRVNYAVFSIFVTSYVVLLLAYLALPATSTAIDRVVATLIGGALAMGMYFAWPTWESSLVGPELGQLIAAQAAWASTLLNCFVDPAGCNRTALAEKRTASRLARSAAEASLQRMADEPARSRHDATIDLPVARGILAACRRIALSLLTLQAHLPDQGASPLPEAQELTSQLVEAMQSVANALSGPTYGRGALRPADPKLRATHDRLAHEIEACPHSGQGRLPVFLTETDLLVDAVNTTADVLARSS
jgi:uncharacterized membrane protein YccC